MIDMRQFEPAFIPDIYFDEGYGRLDAEFLGGEWRTVADQAGAWQMPIVVTELGRGLREAVSPYGYSGIYVQDGMTAADAAVAWDSARELLIQQGIVSLFLRFSPIDPLSLAVAEEFQGLETKRTGTTYLVSIDEPDAMWHSMEGRARTAIRKSRQYGISGAVRLLEHVDLEAGSDFRRLYEGTMHRVDASNRYFFDDDYYSRLFAAMGDSLLIAEVRNADGVVASSLVMRHADVAHYHLSGSDPDAARLGANAVLVWSILEWCAEVGVRRCHLGGGVFEGDGLSKFKRSFGGDTVGFYTGRSVVDEDAYGRLTVERAEALGTTVAKLDDSGYFPAYRASAK